MTYGTEPMAVTSRASHDGNHVKYGVAMATTMGMVVFLVATGGASKPTSTLLSSTPGLSRTHGVRQVPITLPRQRVPHTIVDVPNSNHVGTAIQSPMRVPDAQFLGNRVVPLAPLQGGLPFLLVSVVSSMVAVIAKFWAQRKPRESCAMAMCTMTGTNIASESDTSTVMDQGEDDLDPFCFDANATSFPPIPIDGELRQCIVLVRHGDRAPLTRDMGTLVNAKDTESFWRECLPSPKAVARMDSRFPVQPHQSQLIAWDEGEQPFSQLTAQGLAKITTLGCALRERFVSGCAPTNSSILNAVVDPKEVQVVSTNTKRTQQSSQVSTLCFHFHFRPTFFLAFLVAP